VSTPIFGASVHDVRDGLVRATDPPTKAVRVDLAVGGGIESFTVYIGETEGFGREDLIVRRGGRLLVILGQETLHAVGPLPSWHLVQPDDEVLASVRMPPNTRIVFQSFVVDRRTFGART
jgi:hypothetical protein